ncbi:MAG: hypothetical protein ACFFC7_01885 [Candidatus Hermodarchaeota archaeon]
MREKSKFDRVDDSEFHQIQTTDGSKKTVILLHKELIQLKDLSLTFMRHDGSYGNYKINSKQDFVDLLNSFRLTNKIESLEETVCVFWLKCI